jgi:hypothetical protein
VKCFGVVSVIEIGEQSGSTAMPNRARDFEKSVEINCDVVDRISGHYVEIRNQIEKLMNY